MKSLLITTTVTGLIFGFMTQVQAQGNSVSVEAPAKQGLSAAEYWTPERLQSAKPIDLPRAAEPSGAEILEAPIQGKSISAPGRGPTVKVTPNNTKLFEPIKSEIQPDSAQEVIPYSSGTANAYFTSSRVTPAPTAQNSTPFMVAGKLFYSDASGGNWVCSASVVRPRLVITAGHCVYDAAKKQWYKNFLFIPAFHNGSAPYGTWNWQWVITTTNWINGGDIVPNSGDFALLEMKDNSSGKTIGSITGYYGYRTYALNPNHVTMLGYPVAFDSGYWMHRVDSQSFRANSLKNTVEYGSDMTGGSSGGPWLENFGLISIGQSVTPSGMDSVVGVTSYGPTDITQRYQGASILDTQFTNSSRNGILDQACTHKAGNC